MNQLKAQLDEGAIDVAVLNSMDGLGEGHHSHELYKE